MPNMLQHHFHVKAAAEKLLLLYTIVVSSLLVLTPRSNDFIWEQLKNYTPKFKIVTHPPFQLNGFKCDPTEIFDKIIDCFNPGKNEPSRSGSMRNVEHFTIHEITGDGRCMFRALVQGMAANTGVELGHREEEFQADELKKAIKEVICDNDEDHPEFEDAILSITIEESLESYCQSILRTDFWGGESELLILSKLLSLPIIVYIPRHEDMIEVDLSAGFIEIARYRPEFKNGSTRGEPKNVVRLLFSDGDHYDLLR